MCPDAPPPERDRRHQRGDATRARILAAARELFSTRGYAAVGTNELISRAGVTRGALYHHFHEKRDLFAAVYEQAEAEIVERTVERMDGVSDAWEALTTGVRAFFDVCGDPPLRQVALMDGPAVLGWAEWREIGRRYGFGMVTAALQNAMDTGAMRQADVTQLAHLFMGALAEAAMVLAHADDPEALRPRVEETVFVLLDGLRA